MLQIARSVLLFIVGCLGLVAMPVGVAAAQANSAIRVENLRCEYRVNLWVVETSSRNEVVDSVGFVPKRISHVHNRLGAAALAVVLAPSQPVDINSTWW